MNSETEPSELLHHPDEELEWKKLKLSLERPYKDDLGEKIPVLLDIEPDGRPIYETKETHAERLKKNLHRIFQERGLDFFDDPEKRSTRTNDAHACDEGSEDDETPSGDNETEAAPKPMTLEELNTMRSELLPQLYVALGEISQARDLLTALLTSPPDPSNNASPTAALSATVVSRLPPIPSLQAFNSQIVIGSKDEALRKAADLFNSAATRMKRSHDRSELYWVHALKIRRSNWRLIPSPLPPGSFVGKGADRTAKDFLISYGLEESPGIFRRRALANLSDADGMNNLVFNNRQHTQMQVSLLLTDPAGHKAATTNANAIQTTGNILDDTLNAAQTEIVDQEIFGLLIKEASNLPTALARVSERLIVIDAAQGVELKLELVKDESRTPSAPDRNSSFCDIIYRAFHVLLLRRHIHGKVERLNATAVFPPNHPPGFSPPMLQPIIDFLQYKVFCERLEAELLKAAQGLNTAGISTVVTFSAVGETGHELVQMLSEPRSRPVSGEAILRINERHTLRLTFVAPSNLTAHLSQATLHVYSLPQLSQLLMNEIERFLLQRICQLGQKLRGGTWFIDLDHLVARWDGCVLTFQIIFEKDLGINCTAFRLESRAGKRGNLSQYSRANATHTPLLAWIEDIISTMP